MNKQIFLSFALVALVSFSASHSMEESEGSAGSDSDTQISSVTSAVDVSNEKVQKDKAKDKGESSIGEKVSVAGLGDDDEVVVQDKEKADSESRIRGALNYLKTKCETLNNKFVIGGVSAIVSIYVAHKIMYIKCPWYRNWVDGVDEDSEENKMPWAQT